MVETIGDFSTLTGQKAGGKVSDGTAIVCHTSLMPFAGRKASTCTGTTLGDDDREMGDDGLVIAASSLRSTQARCQSFGRLEDIAGEKGITFEDFVTQQKAAFLCMVCLQQDAFDTRNASVSLDRQQESCPACVVWSPATIPYPARRPRAPFRHLTGLLKALNDADARSPEHAELLVRVEALSAFAP